LAIFSSLPRANGSHFSLSRTRRLNVRCATFAGIDPSIALDELAAARSNPEGFDAKHNNEGAARRQRLRWGSRE
jgi:hypothetical protein